MPDSFGLLYLTKLDLSRNKLISVPESFGYLNKLDTLEIGENRLESLPESFGYLVNLTELSLDYNQLKSLPSSSGNLTKLRHFGVTKNKLKNIPDSFGCLTKLTGLSLSKNQITILPESFGNLVKLKYVDLNGNQLTSLPESIGKLENLEWLKLISNQLTILPKSLVNLTKIIGIYLSGNPLTDLSILQSLPNLKSVKFLGVDLPRRYWTKLSEWKAEWLLDEENTEIRRVLIGQIGYSRIFEELDALTIDSWREYTLLKIDAVERVFDRTRSVVGSKPMMLLKMTCPSTSHIHILRVPPEMTTAEAAITWVNHGIHPDDIAVQT